MANLGAVYINDPITKDGKKPAERVTKRLAVSFSNVGLDNETFKVYVIVTNKPIIDVRLSSIAAARALAIWIEESYGEFLDVYETVPDWDVLQIARLSIPDGERIYSELLKFGDDIVNLEQVEKAKNGRYS